MITIPCLVELTLRDVNGRDSSAVQMHSIPFSDNCFCEFWHWAYRPGAWQYDAYVYVIKRRLHVHTSIAMASGNTVLLYRYNARKEHIATLEQQRPIFAKKVQWVAEQRADDSYHTA